MIRSGESLYGSGLPLPSDWQVLDASGSAVVPDYLGAVYPGRVGFWSLDRPSGRMETGVNLLDEGETNPRPRWTPDIRFKTGEPDGDSRRPLRENQFSRNRGLPENRPLLIIFLLAALFTLAAEWVVQTRIWGRR
jgi:hypothetical protein